MTTANTQTFEYQMLGRLMVDNDAFLISKSERRLWAGNVADQIAEMKKIYASLKVKPEWLSMADIEAYEIKMHGVTSSHEYVSVIGQAALVALGWGRTDGAAFASKAYQTLSGAPVFAYLSKGDGFHFALSADFQSEGRNVLSTSTVLIPINSGREVIERMVAEFDNQVDFHVKESFSYRMACA